VGYLISQLDQDRRVLPRLLTSAQRNFMKKMQYRFVPLQRALLAVDQLGKGR